MLLLNTVGQSALAVLAITYFYCSRILCSLDFRPASFSHRPIIPLERVLGVWACFGLLRFFWDWLSSAGPQARARLAWNLNRFSRRR